MLELTAILPRLSNLQRQSAPKSRAWLPRSRQKMRRTIRAWAVGVVRLHFALDHAKAAGAIAGKIHHGIDGVREHRTLDEVVCSRRNIDSPRVFANRRPIDQRRQILATLGANSKLRWIRLVRGRHVVAPT